MQEKINVKIQLMHENWYCKFDKNILENFHNFVFFYVENIRFDIGISAHFILNVI